MGKVPCCLFFCRLKEVGIDGVYDVTVLKSNLSECVTIAITPLSEFENPTELAQVIEVAIIDNLETTMVTTGGLLDLLIDVVRISQGLQKFENLTNILA